MQPFQDCIKHASATMGVPSDCKTVVLKLPSLVSLYIRGFFFGRGCGGRLIQITSVDFSFSLPGLFPPKSTCQILLRPAVHGSCCQASRRSIRIVDEFPPPTFRPPWAPSFGARRCAWCSSSSSRAQPTTVSVSWGSWAWSSLETWVTFNFGSLAFRNFAQLYI